MTLYILFSSLYFLVFPFTNPGLTNETTKVNPDVWKNHLRSDSFIDISNTQFYTNENRLERLNENNNYILILKNTRGCADCFKSINNYIRNLKSPGNIRTALISLVDSTSLERKRNFYFNKKLMPDIDEYLFQFITSDDQTLFEQFKTKYTPEIILVKSGNIIHIPYPEIFEFPSLEISTATSKKVNEFLK